MKKIIFGYFLLVFALHSYSQTLIDPGNNPTLKGKSRVRIAVLDNAGNLYLGGNIAYINDNFVPPIVKLNAGDTVDGTFNYDGYYSSDFENNLAILDNVTVLNNSLYINGSNNVVKLLSDGSTDESFGFSGVGFVNSMIGYRDSLLIVGEGSKVQLYAEDGNYREINTGLEADNYLLGLTKLSDNKVLLLVQNKSTAVYNYVLLIDAVIKDQNFVPVKINEPGNVRQIALLPDGNIMVVGKTIVVNDTSGNGIFYLDATGAITSNSPHNADISFIDVYNGGLEMAVPLSDGKLLVVGHTDLSEFSNFSLARLLANGTRDNSFVIKNFVVNDPNQKPKMLMDANNEIYLINDQLSYDGVASNGINKIDINGDPVSGYSVNIFGMPWVNQFTPYDTDKFLISGDFVESANGNRPHLSAFSYTTYSYPWLAAADIVIDDIMGLTKVLSNGDVFIGMYDKSMGGVFKVYNQDGTPVNLGTNQAYVNYVQRPVYNIHESANYIYTTGNFYYNAGGATKNNVIKMNKDYSIVTSYTPANDITPSDDVPFSYLTSDDKLIVQHTNNSADINNIIRLMPNGDKDNTFNDIVIGNMAYGGSKTFVVADSLLLSYKYDYNNPQTIEIYDLDGNLIDNNFVTFSADGSISEIIAVSDTVVLLGGSFSTINGVSKKNIALVNHNGTVYDDLTLTVNGGHISAMTLYQDTLYILGPGAINNHVGGGFYAFSLSVSPMQLDSVTVTDTGKIRFDWKYDNSIGEYKIYRADSTNPETLIATLERGTTSFIDASAAFNTKYTYRIVAGNLFGTSEKIVTYEVVKPSRPTDLQIQYDGTMVGLTWVDNSTNETGFQLFQKIDNGEFGLLYQTPPDTVMYSFAAPGLDHDYAYQVIAISDNYYSDSSNIVTLSLIRPDAPANLSFTYDKDTEITTLTWEVTDNRAINFIVFESLDGQQFNALDTLAATTLSYQRNTPEATIYYFYVVAKNDIGLSDPSATVEVNTAILGLNSLEAVNNIYPNPSSGEVRIDLPKPGAERVIITDLSGKIIRNIPVKNEVSIEIANLPKGVLLISLIDHNHQITVKKIVVK